MTLSNLLFLATETGEDISWGEAGLNTAMGLGIVFVALAFISFIIALEGKILTAFQSKKSAKAVTAPSPVETNSSPEPEVVEEDMSDEEIAAVISAAIYAYESENGGEVPADGLVVRSIRRMGYAR